MKNFYMIDLDGTMYRGTQIIEGAKKWIDYLIATHQPFIFLTNNSSRTQVQACEHMLKMGYENIKPEMFYTSAMAAADTVRRQYPTLKKANYIGEEGMRQALLQNGFTLVDEGAEVVFIGLDRNADYRLYSSVLKDVVNGALLVGTNNDRILLNEKGANIGNGSVVKMFEYASGKEALKIGKPHPAIIEGALNYCRVSKEKVMIVGDNLETDIALGNKVNIRTTFVTTGVHMMEDCHRLNIIPTYIVSDLSSLIHVED